MLFFFLASGVQSDPESRNYHYNIHNNKRKLEEVQQKLMNFFINIKYWGPIFSYLGNFL